MSSIKDLQKIPFKELKQKIKDLGCEVELGATKNDLIKLIARHKTTPKKVAFLKKKLETIFEIFYWLSEHIRKSIFDTKATKTN